MAKPSTLDPSDLFDIRSLLSDEERMVQDTVARFTDEKVIPIIGQCFDEHRFPSELIPEIASLGLLGSSLPEEYGCANMSGVMYGLICQELERGDSGIRSFVSVQSSLCMYPIFAFGSEEQRRKYLPPMARGELIGCFGLTEPHGGSDPVQHEDPRAPRRRRLGHQRLQDVDHQRQRRQHRHRLGDDRRRHPGLPDRERHAGLRHPEHRTQDEPARSVTSALFFDDVRIPDSQRLPNVRGLKGPLSCLTQARYGITWGPIGAAIACYREALEYAKSRIIFGKPIAATQAVQLKLADMARRITLAQLLSLQLGRLKDAGTMQPTQVSMAKWNNVRMAIDIAREARDILGGAGITVEYCPIRHGLNLESVITYEGTETVHQLVVGREITGINAF